MPFKIIFVDITGTVHIPNQFVTRLFKIKIVEKPIDHAVAAEIVKLHGESGVCTGLEVPINVIIAVGFSTHVPVAVQRIRRIIVHNSSILKESEYACFLAGKKRFCS